jgi:hypothetical protein
VLAAQREELDRWAPEVRRLRVRCLIASSIVCSHHPAVKPGPSGHRRWCPGDAPIGLCGGVAKSLRAACYLPLLLSLGLCAFLIR